MSAQLAGEFKGARCRSHIDNPSEMEDYDSVFNYLQTGKYPKAFDKNQRRVLRRKSQEHFKIDSGVLYYSNVSSKATATGSSQTSRIAVRSKEEKRRILESCHSDQHGEFVSASVSLCLLHLITVLNLYCTCRLPWNKHYDKLGALIQCDKCKKWYHTICCDISSTSINS